MSGALNIGFLPTRSIIGSSLEFENSHAFACIEDPFNGEKIGVVKALNPDISIIHAWASDKFGNVISLFHSQDTLYGAKASKKGIIVTVEKIVSTDFIKKHSSLVKIPGYKVNSVSLAPFGAHPQTQIAKEIPEFVSYSEDYQFMNEYRKATKKSELLDLWVKNWVLDCKNHEEYLEKLGKKRIAKLVQKGTAKYAPSTDKCYKHLSMDSNYSEIEMMLIVASRLIEKKIMNGNYTDAEICLYWWKTHSMVLDIFDPVKHDELKKIIKEGKEEKKQLIKTNDESTK